MLEQENVACGSDMSEKYEYSHEKAECGSLPHKNARIQFIKNTTKQK